MNDPLTSPPWRSVRETVEGSTPIRRTKDWSTVILLAGLLVSSLVAALLVLAGKHPAEAITAGILALGGAIAGLHLLIE